MASRLSNILSEFVQGTGQDIAQPMGEGNVSSSESAVAQASHRMSQLARSNAYIMNAAVAVVICLFLGCVALVIYYRHEPNTAILVMGGNGLQLLLLVGWLRRLWIEKTTVETLLVAAEVLPPSDAAKLLVAFYFRATQRK